MTVGRLTLVAVAWIVGGVAFAADVRMPGGKPLPAKSPAIQPKIKVVLPVWLAHAGCDLLLAPDQPKKAEGPATQFLERFALAGQTDTPAADGEIKPLEATVGQRTFCLLARLKKDEKGNEKDTIAEYVGWVDKRLLLLSPDCLEVTETKLHRKAMVVRTKKDVLDRGEEGAFFDSPALTGKPLEVHKLHQIFFVYAEAPIDPDKPEKGSALLLGTSPRFKPEDPERRVFGWGNAASLCQWNTREGIEFNETTFATRAKNDDDLAAVYLTEKGAKLALDQAKGKVLTKDEREEVKVVLREPFLVEKRPDKSEVKVPIEPKPRTMRIAVLNKLDQLKPPLYEVGLPGGFYDKDGNQKMEAPEAEELKMRLAQVQEGLTKIEIVFVVGRAEWARLWFEEMKGVVEDIIGDAKKLAKPENVRVGLVVYGNKGDVLKELELTSLDKDGDKKLKDMVRDLELLGTTDPSMPLLAAIKRATEQPFTHTSYGRKLIVVCGHFGDYADDTAPFNKFKALATRFVPDKERPPIELLALHMTTPTNASKQTELFEKQFKALGGELDELTQKPGMLFPARSRFVSVDTSKDAADARRAVHERYKALIEQQDRLSAEFAKAGRVGTGDIIRGVYGKDAAEIARRNGFDRLADGQQVFHTGFIWEKSLIQKEDQVRRRILVNLQELAVVTKGVDAIRNQSPGLSVQKRIHAGVVALVQGQAGYTTIPEESPDMALKRTSGLNFKSPLLERYVSRTERSNAAIEAELQNIYHRGYLLEDIGTGQEYEYSQRPTKVGEFDGVPEWVRGPKPKPKPRDFPLGGSEASSDKQFKWFWIDFDKEWP